MIKIIEKAELHDEYVDIPKKHINIDTLNAAVANILATINLSWNAQDASEACDHAQEAIDLIIDLMVDVREFQNFCANAADTQTP